MDLQKQFQKFTEEKKLFSKKNKILLAVSGGVDSVVMTELFHRCGYRFAIAHCNFQLRGKESEKDEAFVKALAKKHGVKFYVKNFETKAFARENKLSIQEAARDLRYQWFLNIKTDDHFYAVATAHHFNDNIETFFINLLRGTGLAGLRGIQSARTEDQHEVVRPLLFANRKDIEAFAKKENIKFRHDASNDTDAYLRNRIRHHLVPLLNKLNPQFEKVMKRNIETLIFAEHIYTWSMVKELSEFLHHGNGDAYFVRKELEGKTYSMERLGEFLETYGFNSSQRADIWKTTKSGKQFFSARYSATIDRGKIILSHLKSSGGKEFLLSKRTEEIAHALFTLRIKKIAVKEKKNVFKIPSEQNIHCLDLKNLEFPLTIRKWKAGDFFYPLGMNHKKKISDFLVDQKISRPEKEKTYVLVSGKDIVAVLGQRIDDRYKITAETKNVYSIEYLRT